MGMIDGRTVLVTGSSRGIGRGIAIACAAEGARVVLNGRDLAGLEETAGLVERSGAEALIAPADLTDPDGVAALRELVVQSWGTPDVVVANAGGSTVRPGPLEELDPADWSTSVAANLTATYLTLRAFLPGMKKRGSGVIITISSAAARRPDARSPVAYGAAKAGIEYLTRFVAAEAGPYGVRANCIAPETIMTEGNQQRIPAGLQDQLAAEHPVRRLGTVDDVSNAVLYLASERSSWVSGVVLDVAGGSVFA